MALPPWRVKKSFFILLVAVLAPVVLVGVVALAANEWRQAGSTASGDQVLVSSVTRQRNGLRSAWIRVEYKEPITLPQGGPFVELRARARFNCSRSGSAPTMVSGSEWLYSRDHSGNLVVSKKTRRDDQFGAQAEGGFAELAKDFVCNQK
jgi:hypothetical protein